VEDANSEETSRLVEKEKAELSSRQPFFEEEEREERRKR